MWISEKMSGNNDNTPFIAAVGHCDGSIAALSGTGGGSASLFMPYGVESVPPTGAKTTVVPAGRTLCAVGFECGGNLSLEPGEVGLFSSGGASIILKNDGSVLINGRSV